MCLSTTAFEGEINSFLIPAHKGWGYSCPLSCPGIKTVGVPQPKPMHLIFRVCLFQEELELIRLWGYLATTVAGQHL